MGTCSSELYSFNLLKLPAPPRAAILVICLLTWLVFEVLSHTIGRFQRRFNGQSFTYHILSLQYNFVAVESVSGKTLPDDFLRISKSQVLPRRIRKTSSHQGAFMPRKTKSLRGAVEEQCWDIILWRSWRNHSWLMEWIHWLMELFIQYMKKPMLHLTFFIWRSKSCWFFRMIRFERNSFAHALAGRSA